MMVKSWALVQKNQFKSREYFRKPVKLPNREKVLPVVQSGLHDALLVLLRGVLDVHPERRLVESAASLKQ